jgi:hypothetical protein
MEDEDLGGRIAFCDHFHARERFFIRKVIRSAGVVIEIIAVTVNDTHDREPYRRLSCLPLYRAALKGHLSAARYEGQGKRRTTGTEEQHQGYSIPMPLVALASPDACRSGSHGRSLPEQKNEYDDTNEQCDKADRDHLIGLFEILHNIIGEGIEL